MLRERGYDGMAIEVVAAAAGAGKATIYRGWSTRAELAVDAFFHATRSELALRQTSSAPDDFRRQVRALAALLRGPRGAVLAAMLGGARTDPELARALSARWLRPRRAWGMQRMKDAIAAGECRAGVQAPAALAVIYGPLYTPLLFGERVPSAEQVDATLDIAFTGIFQRREGRRRT